MTATAATVPVVSPFAVKVKLEVKGMVPASRPGEKGRERGASPSPSPPKKDRDDEKGDKASATAPEASEDEKKKYVVNLNPHDVLLGRGAPIINNEGNVAFRELVRSRKAEYMSTGRHQVKDDIARQIVQEVKKRGGRFLRKIDSQSEAEELGVTPPGTKAWKIAKPDVAIEKAKQALRDREPGKHQRESEQQALGALQKDAAQTVVDVGSRPLLLPNLPDSSGLASNSGAAASAVAAPANSRPYSLSLNDTMQTSTPSITTGNTSYELQHLLQQQEFDQQQLALLQQQHQQQQLIILQQQQQQMALGSLYGLPASVLLGLGAAPPSLTAQAILEMRRREALALATANMQIPPHQQDERIRTPQDLQLAALAALREQQQQEQNRQLLSSPGSSSVMPDGQRLPMLPGVPPGPPPSLPIGDPLFFSLLSQQHAAAGVPASFPLGDGGNAGGVASAAPATPEHLRGIAAEARLPSPSRSDPGGKDDGDRKQSPVPSDKESTSNDEDEGESVIVEPLRKKPKPDRE